MGLRMGLIFAGQRILARPRLNPSIEIRAPSEASLAYVERRFGKTVLVFPAELSALGYVQDRADVFVVERDIIGDRRSIVHRSVPYLGAAMRDDMSSIRSCIAARDERCRDGDTSRMAFRPTFDFGFLGRE